MNEAAEKDGRFTVSRVKKVGRDKYFFIDKYFICQVILGGHFTEF
jgi:hypothetical protein